MGLYCVGILHVHLDHFISVVRVRAFAMNINSILFFSFFFFAENVREFQCGKQYYRTFHLDEERDVLYVGAM